EIDAGSLGAVAQRGIEQMQAFLHRGRLSSPLRASFFSMVVLASHSSPHRTLLRCCAVKPRRWKQPRALSLASTVSRAAPRDAARLAIASHSIAPAPCPAAAGWM